QRAVLADAPALLLEPALLRRDPQLVVRVPPGARFVGVEELEVAADDLIGAVALDSLGAWVPRPDPAGHVEHEDRVVAHARDQQAELLELGVGHPPLRRARPHLLGGELPARQVTGHLAEADERAVVLAERRDHHIGPKSRAVLANPPALALMPARGPRLVEDLLRQTGLDVLLGIERGEVSADDLVRL